MLRVIGRMLVGKASVENLSGPISIAETAGKTASYGLGYFVKFLAVVSISLGVLNLLPIPILDGGHLLYFAIEAVKGSPLSEQAQLQGQRVGIAMLGGAYDPRVLRRHLPFAGVNHRTSLRGACECLVRPVAGRNRPSRCFVYRLLNLYLGALDNAASRCGFRLFAGGRI